MDIQDDYVVDIQDDYFMSTKFEDEMSIPLLGGEFINIENITLQGPKAKFPLAIDSDVELVQVSAMLSYCTYDKQLTSEADCPAYIEKTCENIPFKSLRFNSMNAVLVCKRKDRVFVSLTGTQSHMDEASDLTFFAKNMNLPNKESKFAHSGFVTRSEQFSLWVTSALSDIEGVGQMEIVLTGHSLGGGLATLLAHDIYTGLRLDVHGGVSNALNQVKVITFGSPSVISDASGYLIGHSNHLRFHNQHDIVANHSAKLMHSISGYEHVGVELIVPNQEFLNVLKIDEQIQKQTQDVLEEVTEDHQSIHPKKGTKKRSILELIGQPADSWTPKQPIPVYHPFTMKSHSKIAYTVLAKSVFLRYQGARRQEKDLISMVNVADALEKRLGSPVSCKSMANNIVCSANSNVVAKFRYAQDGENGPVDECMSLIVKNNAIPGITLNAGISLQGISPNAATSEALVLNISATDPWYRDVPPKVFNSLFIDGFSKLPEQCARKPTYLSYEESMSTERAMIRDSIERPSAYNLLESKPSSTPLVKLIRNDMSFFGDQDHEDWIDCSLPNNQPFCPSLCQRGNNLNSHPVCHVMKKYLEEDGDTYYVSISGKHASGINYGNSWQLVVQEKKPVPYWFSPFRGKQVGKEVVMTIIQE